MRRYKASVEQDLPQSGRDELMKINKDYVTAIAFEKELEKVRQALTVVSRFQTNKKMVDVTLLNSLNKYILELDS
jgi:hypothetical protein